MIATNSTGQIRFINSLAEVLTGWNKTEALGKELEEVFLPLGEVTDESSLEEVLPEKQTPELISRNGSRVTIQGTVTPIKDYKKRVTGLVVVFKVQEE